MDTRISPGGSRVDLVVTETAPRVTPSSGIPFRDVVSRGAQALLNGAQAAITSLPGAPIVAAAVRSRGTSPSVSGSSLSNSPLLNRAGASPSASGVTESPVSSSSADGTSTGAESSSVEGALAQSQEFNLYYLQLQEQLAAENRSYSAMSNVLKARHDTVKNAIGNIR
jgi:hypothetical protein